MFRLLADENFNHDIVRGLYQHDPQLDLVTVQKLGWQGISDPEVLERAAGDGRIVLTHDRNTMTGYAYDRVRAGLPMPGVFVLSKLVSVGQAVQSLIVVLECSVASEWENQVIFLPYP
ncbi:MAG: DUF5615 family PIN-like protein [Planctomycetia bacterium]|nr:DUF5615 family PIN-like protein [Planctomycetia bacterium]